MYEVYILKSLKHNKTYTGITTNKERRLRQHNQGNHPYTKRYKPWKIIHTEKFKTRTEARKRERYLKSSAGRKWIKKALFNKTV